MTFEFLKYQDTPGEKHLGIATVKLYGKIILRYKIVPTKDGTSFFPAPASYKTITDTGEERYISAFTLDSTSENELLSDMIRSKVKSLIKDHKSVFVDTSQKITGAVTEKQQTATQPSLFNAPAHQHIDEQGEVPF